MITNRNEFDLEQWKREMEQRDSRNGAPIAELVVVGALILEVVVITVAAVCLW